MMRFLPPSGWGPWASFHVKGLRLAHHKPNKQTVAHDHVSWRPLVTGRLGIYPHAPVCLFGVGPHAMMRFLPHSGGGPWASFHVKGLRLAIHKPNKQTAAHDHLSWRSGRLGIYPHAPVCLFGLRPHAMMRFLPPSGGGPWASFHVKGLRLAHHKPNKQRWRTTIYRGAHWSPGDWEYTLTLPFVYSVWALMP
jgi:hypothetical protein